MPPTLASLWSEEFRPDTLNDVIGQPAVEVLKAYVRHKNVVDINLIGPPGVGKTSAILAMVKELYGLEFYENNFKILNASDERGIDVVRNQIKNFTFQGVANPENVPFLICFLDEADGLTSDSQDALRATIEAHSNNCRFILSCNTLSGLIEALQSRAPSLPFYPLSPAHMTDLVNKICLKKNLTITDDALSLLISSSNGDMRNLIKRLQIAAMLNPNITTESLTKFIPLVNDSTTEKIMSFVFDKDLQNTRSLLIELYSSAHYDAESILVSIDRVINKMEDQFPNKIAFYKAQVKIGQAFRNIKQTKQPLYALLELLNDIILINQTPINCHYVKEG